MTQIGPFDILANGTRVGLPSRRGTITGHTIAPNGVVVHTVAITERYDYPNRRWRPVNAEWTGNYSFVARDD